MLGTSKSNIHVSIARGGQDHAIEGDHRYRRSQQEWYLSLEPHKHHVPGIPHTKDGEPVHFQARTDNTTGSYLINVVGVKSEPEILGNILVAENVKTTSEYVQSLLKEKLVAEPSSLPSEQTSEDESNEQWIRRGE